MAKLEKTIDDLEGTVVTPFTRVLPSTSLCSPDFSVSVFSFLICTSLHFSHLPALALFAHRRADELYNQKLKYKAISEELDNALNDLNTL